ncbi:MAG: cysteine desulfurase family protein [Candidatus Sericytochromatia bacterium]
MSTDCKPIYLDYHSTTPVDKRVAEKIMQYMITDFGNPGSVTHSYSQDAQKAIDEAKKNIQNLLNAESSKVIFTSGATESLNLAIIGTVTRDCSKKHKIAVLPVEHKAVLDTCKTLEKKNLIETIFLDIDSKGRLDLDSLEKACQQDLSLICVMMANNEIGNIYPIKKVCEIANKYNVPVLCDATQGTGKVNIEFNNWGLTYMTISAHKMYGPKGSGALIIKKGAKLSPMLCGGGQQEGLRPGTLNVSGIVGLGECCKIAKEEMEEDNKRIKENRDFLLNKLIENFPHLIINGDIENKLCGNISVSFPSLQNQDIISSVRDKIAISTGSACSSGFENASHVLTAMKLPNDTIFSTLRICVGKYTTQSDVEKAAEALINAIKGLYLKKVS